MTTTIKGRAPADHDQLVNRTVTIRARPSTVFRYFTDSDRFAAWWGAGSQIEGRPGGRVHICYPGGTTAGGEVIELVPDQRIVFSYGYDDPGKGLPRGSSRVTVTLEAHPEGTLLRLVHQLPDAGMRDAHDPGWRFQLSLFANVVTREGEGALPVLLDAYFAVWSERDAVARAHALEALVDDQVLLRDRFSAIQGRDDLVAHMGASQQHLPGVTLARVGPPLQVQGTVLCDWEARTADGAVRGRGTNVVDLDPEGRIVRMVGFWRP